MSDLSPARSVGANVTLVQPSHDHGVSEGVTCEHPKCDFWTTSSYLVGLGLWYGLERDHRSGMLAIEVRNIVMSMNLGAKSSFPRQSMMFSATFAKDVQVMAQEPQRHSTKDQEAQHVFKN
eukprot:6321909-Amphidinium_carterae.1